MFKNPLFIEIHIISEEFQERNSVTATEEEKKRKNISNTSNISNDNENITRIDNARNFKFKDVSNKNHERMDNSTELPTSQQQNQEMHNQSNQTLNEKEKTETTLPFSTYEKNINENERISNKISTSSLNLPQITSMEPEPDYTISDTAPTHPLDVTQSTTLHTTISPRKSYEASTTSSTSSTKPSSTMSKTTSTSAFTNVTTSELSTNEIIMKNVFKPDAKSVAILSDDIYITVLLFLHFFMKKCLLE